MCTLTHTTITDQCMHNHKGTQHTASCSAPLHRAMDGRMSALEASRDLSRTWLHADMDCFYAAVHEAENPQLVGSKCGAGL